MLKSSSATSAATLAISASLVSPWSSLRSRNSRCRSSSGRTLGSFHSSRYCESSRTALSCSLEAATLRKKAMTSEQGAALKCASSRCISSTRSLASSASCLNWSNIKAPPPPRAVEPPSESRVAPPMRRRSAVVRRWMALSGKSVEDTAPLLCAASRSRVSSSPNAERLGRPATASRSRDGAETPTALGTCSATARCTRCSSSSAGVPAAPSRRAFTSGSSIRAFKRSAALARRAAERRVLKSSTAMVVSTPKGFKAASMPARLAT
mmetsp:Transcript_137473/g.439245  ORF Transcript_137473/g.439245 Transcript_137473/m.439245 type:complete len:266 (+) Transcript_137473:3467-4264(+)